MLGKPRILSLFLNLCNKFNKTMSTHLRSSINNSSSSLEAMRSLLCVNIEGENAGQ